MSWNRWLEPYVDSGRELMVPWRVAHGERLYAEVEFHHGPLAPLLGAACDRIFGASLPARTGLAAGLALGHLAALGRLARRMLSPWRAGLATSVAVAAAFFLRPGGWLFPFSFDAALAVAAATWALALSLDDTRRRDALAGGCLAAAILARPEIGLAALAILAFAARRQRRLWRLAIAPVLIAAAGYAAVSAGIRFSTLVADGWLRLLAPPEAFRNVYQAYAGLDRLGLRSAEWLLAMIGLTLIAAVLCLVSLSASRAGTDSSRTVIEAAAILLLALAAAMSLFPPESLSETAALWPPFVRVVPPFVVAAALLRLLRAIAGKPPTATLSGVPDAVLWIAAVFAARLLLAAGYVGPYNAFFLPLPIVVSVAAVFAAADRASGRLGAPLPRLAGAALAVFLAARIAALAGDYRRPGWARVETPAGPVVLREPAAAATREALADLARRLPPGAALAGFPEAGFFRYVLGLSNPYPHEQYFPGHLEGDQEASAVRQLRDRPPDAVLYANVLAVGEGARSFGKDYDRALDAAVRSATVPAAAFGPGARSGARIGDPDFFVEVRIPATSGEAGPR